MKSNHRFHDSPWLLLVFLMAVSLFSAGCSSSSSDSGASVNPLGAYQTVDSVGGLPVDGAIKNPGAIDKPIITLPIPGTGIDGHDNAPLLDNMHPGWQQASCLTCHNETSRNPDHNYTDSSMCYLCHGTNGLPGFGDTIPPVISGVVVTPTHNSVTIIWKTDEETISRLVLRTTAGDRLEFPVSTTYSTGHRYEMSGLLSSTIYTYELIATDKSGNKTSSATFGTLNFTTLQKPATSTSGSGTTTTPAPATNFFSGISISKSGAFNASIRFTVEGPARCTAFFVLKENNSLADQVSLSSGQAITSFDGTVGSLQPNTEYIVFVEAKEEATGSVRKTSNYEIKTDNFN